MTQQQKIGMDVREFPERPAPVKSGFTRPGLKAFLVSGLVWLAVALAARGVWSAGCYTARQVRRFQNLIEWTETLPDGGGKGNPFFNRRKRSRGPLESWIGSNLPRAGEEERLAAAGAFRETAAMLRRGELRGERDAMAELTARLAVAVDRDRWYPFLEALSDRLADEFGPGAGAERVAGTLERAAGALAGAEPAEAPGTDADASSDENAGAQEDDETERNAASEKNAAANGKGAVAAGPAAAARAGCAGGSCPVFYYRYF